MPRRISHFTALALAPAAVKVGGALDVSGPPVDYPTAARLAVIPREESRDTLFIGASPWDGATWVSQPERAVLECLQSDDHVPGGEAVAAEVLHRDGIVAPGTVVSLAHQLGWDAPLRRLASLAASMDNCRGLFRHMPDGFLPDSQRQLLDVPPAPTDADWICLKPSRQHPEPAGDGAYRDEKHRVVWCWQRPQELLEDLLY